jgi:hypothetical protein
MPEALVPNKAEGWAKAAAGKDWCVWLKLNNKEQQPEGGGVAAQ